MHQLLRATAWTFFGVALLIGIPSPCFAHLANTDRFDADVGPHLGLASSFLNRHSRFSGIDGGDVGIKRALYEVDADSCYYQPNPSRYCGVLVPISRLPLGLKIALGTPLLPIGFWIAWRGLAGDDWRNKSIWHLARGVLMLLSGSALILVGLLMPVL